MDDVKVRFKFRCDGVKCEPGPTWFISFSARWEPQSQEDRRFQTGTPHGLIELHTTCPLVSNQFKEGDLCYVDFVPTFPLTDWTIESESAPPQE